LEGVVLNSKVAWTRILKFVLVGLVLVTGLVSIGADIYVRFHYAEVMPRVPQPETGRVYPVPAQGGGTVYVTEGEFKRREFVRYKLTYIFGGVLFLYGCVGTVLGWWNVGLKRGGA
jgi:hypothetical protein